MVREDETALICDLAETYHILDWRALPLAALSAGLREDSRIKMKIAGMKADQDTLLLAAAVDRLSLLMWAKTKDGQKGRNPPKSIFDELTRRPEDKKENEKATVYDSVDAFREAWKQAVGDVKEVE